MFNKLKNALIIALFLVLSLGGFYMASHYERHGIVTLADDDSVEVTDTTGQVWGLWADDLNVGDHVTLKMYDNANDFYEDDVVVGYEVCNDD